MATDEQIRIALNRAQKAIELRPRIAFGTMKTSTRLQDGLKCISRNGDWSFEIDEPTSAGGENTAPSPGVYGLGALTGCVAMSIKIQAIQSNVPVDGISVDAEADYDERGLFRMDSVPPGFQEFRLSIQVDSPAPTDKVRKVVEEALRISSWFDVFTRGQKLTTDISVTAGAETATQ